MRSPAARIIARVVGVIAILVGALWIGQGLGVLPGAAMSGVLFWFWVGLVLVIVGIALLWATRRRTVPTPTA
jgi:predicted phage tail protein